METLLHLGADPKRPDNLGQLPIFRTLLLPVIHNDNEKENKEKIFRLFTEKAPETLMVKNTSGDTVLHMMAVHNYPNLLHDTLSIKPQLAYIQNNRSHYPIHTAILHKRMECIDILLKQKRAPLLKDSQNRVALHYAVLYAHLKILTQCIQATTNIDPPDSSGKTPLTLAVEAGNFDAIKILVEAGANINAKDNSGNSVLHHAVKGATARLSNGY